MRILLVFVLAVVSGVALGMLLRTNDVPMTAGNWALFASGLAASQFAGALAMGVR